MKRSIHWNLLMITPLVMLLMACPQPVNPTDSQPESGQEIQITPISVYPRVVDYGVYTRLMMGGSSFQYCGNVRVADGSTLNLLESGCLPSATGNPTWRYFGWVSVENPSNEALTYDWNLYVRDYRGEWGLYGDTASVSRIFELHQYLNHIPVTNDCRVTVKVNAVNPRRSKGPFTVWTGRCTYYSIFIH